ncbi:hypothetical protein ZOSMA_121G00680 [Zostera marina]|uniref:Uncharacterized protein n=1 Tax=Zostera marina TaxID=29655 RepID=A0A0K9Q310_ZOSMR|nr:hypothetical protein ZOSMA_121G00680 [Zostera marina]
MGVSCGPSINDRRISIRRSLPSQPTVPDLINSNCESGSDPFANHCVAVCVGS